MPHYTIYPDNGPDMEPYKPCTRCDGEGRTLNLELWCEKSQENVETMCEGCTVQCCSLNYTKCRHCNGEGFELN